MLKISFKNDALVINRNALIVNRIVKIISFD